MTHLLTQHRDVDLSLAELVAAACELLDGAPPPADGRVQALPDARTVRYYQSSGLVDRPHRYEGRQARYAYRHLVQVLAVKLLQRQGQRLATVQRGLAGRTTAQLESAVVQALALPTTAEPVAPPRVPRPLISVELAPGVTLLVDPALVSDPDGLITHLSKHLPGVLS